MSEPAASLADWDLELAEAAGGLDALDLLARATDPGQGETLHWGRNYLYVVELPGAMGGRRLLAVKQFRNGSRRAQRRKRRGESKAARAFRAAGWCTAAGVPTPAPVAWIESRRPDGPSFLVCEYLPGRIELRHLLRERRAGQPGPLAEQFPVEDVLTRLGTVTRRLHEGGILHRDLSVGNVLLGRGEDGELELELLDLNRARRHADPPPAWRCMRDFSRLGLDRPEDRHRLLTAYCDAPPPATLVALQGFWQSAFRAKQAFKARLRAPLRWRKKLGPRSTHGHIEAAPEEAGLRDRAVWDPLSDQPHQHASRLDRLRVRLGDLSSHGADLVRALEALPPAWQLARAVGEGLQPRPAVWRGPSVALRPWPADPEALLAALEPLACRQALLRLHPWESRHEHELQLARELAARGWDLGFVLPQNRQLVLDRGRWAAAVAELGERFLPYGRRFQIGQAVNRSKWGIWSSGEFVELAATAAGILRALGRVELSGPGVIDFEPHALAALLEHPDCPAFDVVSCLLYVDRRGAPENRQLGQDAAAKARLMWAIGAGAAAGSPRFEVAEFNWPLWEGPHSPAGRDVAVDEERQADYLVRYCVEMASTGVVERSAWWQVIAKGYGLIDPASQGLRRRPSYGALQRLGEELAGLAWRRQLGDDPAVRLHEFAAGGQRRVVGWVLDGASGSRYHGPVRAARTRDGIALRPRGGGWPLTGQPAYFDLED